MPNHALQVSDEAYHRLEAEAVRLQLTPEQLLEHLLTGKAAEFMAYDEGQDVPIPPAGSPEALAAVQRLTTLFSDVNIPNLESVLSDPSLMLANADLNESIDL